MTSAAGRPGFVAALILAAGLTLAPAWLEPFVATNDGSSHVYNAALAAAVAAGREPYAAEFELESGLHPNRASHLLLRALGPWLGWTGAERIDVSLAIVGTLLALAGLLRPDDGPPLVALVPLAAWFATSWVVWVGLYDFALSIPCYVAILILLQRPPGVRRDLGLQIAFGLLYITHFFTFTVAIGLVTTVLGWRALAAPGRDDNSWKALRVVLPALALYAIEIASGGPGAGLIRWARDPWQALRGMVTGDFLVSVRATDLVIGLLVALVTALLVVALARVAVRDWRSLSGAEVFGGVLLALSLVAPDAVGEGSFISIRLRLLGTIALLPTLARAARGIRPARLAVPAVGLSLALVAHDVGLVQTASRARQDLVQFDRLFAVADATAGAWVARCFTVYPRGRFENLIERVAVQRDFVVLDNYEALYRIFPIAWRARPDWVTFRPVAGGLVADLVPGAIAWPAGGVYVLHESDLAVVPAGRRLDVVRTVADGRFAVTLVRKRTAAGP